MDVLNLSPVLGREGQHELGTWQESLKPQQQDTHNQYTRRPRRPIWPVELEEATYASNRTWPPSTSKLSSQTSTRPYQSRARDLSESSCSSDNSEVAAGGRPEALHDFTRPDLKTRVRHDSDPSTPPFNNMAMNERNPLKTGSSLPLLMSDSNDKQAVIISLHHEVRPTLGPGPSLHKETVSPLVPQLQNQVLPPPLAKEWQKIQDFRGSIWRLRSKIQELRKGLRAKQYAKSLADDRYIQYIRQCIGLQGSGIPLDADTSLNQSKALERLALECQRARDEYGPLEDDCNAAEDQLGGDEYELTKLERNFDKLQKERPMMPDDKYEGAMASSFRSEYSDLEIEEDCHPKVSEYLSKLGDVDIYRERLADHIEEKFELEAEKETRQRVGLELAQDAQEWLDNYPNLEAGVLEQIREAEEEAEKLKQECLSLGLVDEEGNPTTFEAQAQQTFLKDDDGVSSGGETSEFEKYPRLISHPQTTRQEIKFLDMGPKPEEASTGAGDHINQWLLHKLRSSPLDVNLLATIYDRFGGPKGDSWETSVLKFWYKDGSIKGPEDYSGPSPAISTYSTIKTRNSAETILRTQPLVVGEPLRYSTHSL